MKKDDLRFSKMKMQNHLLYFQILNFLSEQSFNVMWYYKRPKEAIKQIHNRLMKKDKKITMLSLELLEYLSYTCEMTLYNQIATKEFMMRIGALLKSHDSDDLVIN